MSWWPWDQSLGATCNAVFGCRPCRKGQWCPHALLAWCQVWGDCRAARRVRDNLRYYEGAPSDAVITQMYMHPDPLQLGYGLAEEFIYMYARHKSLGYAIDYWNSARGCMDLLPQIKLRQALAALEHVELDKDQADWVDGVANWVEELHKSSPDQIDGVLAKLRPSSRFVLESLTYLILAWPHRHKLPAWGPLFNRLLVWGCIDKDTLAFFDGNAPKSWTRIGVTPEHWRNEEPDAS